MVNLFNHQKRIGIVGTGPDASSFIEKANQLGFHTYQLCQREEKYKVISNADKVFTGSIEEERIHEEFIMKTDLLVYFDYSINSQQLEEVNKSVVIPQGVDLLAIARDRALQNAFKESVSVNIAPFEIIVKKEDIIHALPSIGYPAFLRTNFNQPEAETDLYFIYDEEDIEKASELLKYGTCVLESWIVSEYQLSISVVKSMTGQVQLYPIIKKNYRNDRLSSVEKFVSEDIELKAEIEKAARLIVDNLPFTGAVTIDFIISPAQALYIGDIHPYPNSFTRYAEGKTGYSIVEAHLRAVTSLPITEMTEEPKDFIYIPFYTDQKELINELIRIYPDWKFSFYSSIKGDHLQADKQIGSILIETDDLERTKELLKKYNL